ncbi:MAG: F-box-like domain-containing protein [Legionellales bacterium]
METLPQELISHCFSFLSPRTTLLTLSVINKTWHDASSTETLWKVYCSKLFPNPSVLLEHVTSCCRLFREYHFLPQTYSLLASGIESSSQGICFRLCFLE